MLLKGYPAIRSDDSGQAEAWSIANSSVKRVEFRQQGVLLDYRANFARLQNVGAAYVACNVPSVAAFAEGDYVRQIFQTRSDSRVSVAGHVHDSNIEGFGYVIPDGMEFEVSYKANSEALVLRAETTALEVKLSAMTGMNCQNLKFDACGDNDTQHSRVMKATAFKFAREIDAFGKDFSPVATREIEQAVLGRLLIFNRHNYSQLLTKEPTSASLLQLRLIEDHIVANWAEALEVETLSAVAGISARSLFRSFKAWRGCTPQEFIRGIRLDRARALLIEGDDVSVMRIAMQCGFKSLGHFAQAYRAQFGELPSVTARNWRR